MPPKAPASAQKTFPRNEPAKPKPVSAQKDEEPLSFAVFLGLFMGGLFAIFLVIGLTSQAIGLISEPKPVANQAGIGTAPARVSETLAPSRSTPRSSVVETARGTFTIPGQAWTDGRDLEATPPLTVESINVWDAALRSTVVCRVQHGQQVETLAAERNNAEGRWYMKIRRGSCEGWLPEDWLNKQRHPAVGDRV